MPANQGETVLNLNQDPTVYATKLIASMYNPPTARFLGQPTAAVHYPRLVYSVLPGNSAPCAGLCAGVAFD
jgi:hypothetical protein